MKPRVTSGRPHITIAVLLAVVAAGVWLAVFYKVGHGAHFTDGSLMVSNRDKLAICVDSKVPELSNEQLKAMVATGLEQVKTHPMYQRAGLAVAPPSIDIGCPGPMRVWMPGFDIWTGDAEGQITTVAQPSEYRTFVFVVPDEQIQPFRDYDPYTPYPRRRAAQEVFCEGEQCFEVTTSLYLSTADLANRAVLLANLTRGVGLDPEWEQRGQAR
jgi:hypothetical protein